MTDHRSYTHNLSSCESKAWKNSGLNVIATHDLCDTGAVFYDLNYQVIWELVTSWVRNIPVEDEECKWIYERSYIWTAEKDIFMADHHTHTYNFRSCEIIKTWENSFLNGIWTHDLFDTGKVCL